MKKRWDVPPSKLPTDKELPAVMALLTLEQRIELIIRKYVSGAVSKEYDGETTGDIADARIARYLLGKMRPYLPSAPREDR